jgi:hypothetical protein
VQVAPPTGARWLRGAGRPAQQGHAQPRHELTPQALEGDEPLRRWPQGGASGEGKNTSQEDASSGVQSAPSLAKPVCTMGCPGGASSRGLLGALHGLMGPSLTASRGRAVRRWPALQGHGLTGGERARGGTLYLLSGTEQRKVRPGEARAALQAGDGGQVDDHMGTGHAGWLGPGLGAGSIAGHYLFLRRNITCRRI